MLDDEVKWPSVVSSNNAAGVPLPRTERVAVSTAGTVLLRMTLSSCFLFLEPLTAAVGALEATNAYLNAVLCRIAAPSLPASVFLNASNA